VAVLKSAMFERKSSRLSPGSFRARWAFRGSVRSRFYRHLIAQTSNDVQIVDCLKSYHSRLERSGLRDATSVLGATITAMQNGFTLDEALKPWIPYNEYGVLVSGVAANALAASLTRLLTTQERTRALIGQIRSAFSLPAGNLSVAFAFMYFIGKSILPVVQSLVSKDRADSLVRGLYTLGAFATGWGLPTALVLSAAFITLIIWSLPRWTGLLRVRFEKVFPWSFYRDTQGFLWLMGYSSLLAAGTKELTALGTQLTAATPWLAERLRAIRSLMQGGLLLPVALKVAAPAGKGETPASSGLTFDFPSRDMVDDIESLHGFADFPERIERVAEQWSDEMIARTHLITKILGLAANLVTYSLIIYIIYACNDLQASLSSTTGGLPH